MYDTIFETWDEFCDFRFVWRDFKTNKSHINHIPSIACKTALIQPEEDLYRRIYKTERFVKTLCSNGRHEKSKMKVTVNSFFLCKQWYLVKTTTWRKPFSNQEMKLYTAQMITCDI